ncbi:MAG: polysaccharide deacetylase family protein [Candidatus Nealsonbacteria bacterium]
MLIKTCFASVDVEGENIETTDKILEVFKKYKIPATLFLTGEVLEKHADLAKNWAQNYEIACHSFTHRFWNTLNAEEREKELDDFISLYRGIFQKSPMGFRAPSHVIDEQALDLIARKGFLYDSSVVPHYPPFKKYRGYKGKAPLLPFRLKGTNVLEIPVSGQSLGIPLAGAWIRGLPVWFYRILFLLRQPEFITLNMHSWDVSDKRFIKKLEKIIEILTKENYQFKNAEQFSENRK